jgi:hypothetical protein
MQRKNMGKSILRYFVLAATVAACCVNGIVGATTYTVINTNDSGAGSLRDAILSANAGGGEIVFDASVTGKISLASALPELAANITITGPGTNVLTISGANNCRIFSMNPGTTNTVSGLTIADGWASGVSFPFFSTFASGISNAGSLKLVACIVSNCANFTSYGAGVYNAGSIEMEGCLVANCYDPSHSSQTPGGGVYNKGLLKTANCTFSYCTGGYNGSGGGGIYNSGTLFMSASVIHHCQGQAEGDGGGIRNVGETTLIGCVVSNCYGYFGGGIYSVTGPLWMTNCSLLNNEAEQGGGVMSWGTAVLSGCTVARNRANDIVGGVDNLGVMELYNCTISSNVMAFPATQYPSGLGDGIVSGNNRASSIYLNHCTVVSNSGPIQIWTTNTITADYSILSMCVGKLSSSAGHNLLVATNSCTLTNNTTGNLYNVDPLLGPLQNNGGPTLTHALLMGSPALNAAGAADTTSTDQRGVSRPQGPASDIGAYEFSYTAPTIVRITRPSPANSWVQGSGLPGCACTVQASSNCVSWANLTNLIVGANGTLDFIDADAGKYPSRFYRLMLPVPPGSP